MEKQARREKGDKWECGSAQSSQQTVLPGIFQEDLTEVIRGVTGYV